MRKIGRFLVITLALIGTLTVGVSILGIMVGSHIAEGKKRLPERIVLAVDLSAGVADAPQGNPFARFTREQGYLLREVVESLDRGAKDKHVTGLIVRVGDGISLADAQELRQAVERFRAQGKPALAFAETVGESGRGTIAYYLMSAFDDVWLQPSGEIGITGFAVETPFLKGALDTLGIKAQFGRRHEYKNAPESFTAAGYSPPFRESLESLLGSMAEQAVDGIATARKLTPETVRALIDRAPLLSLDAKEAGLVDHLGYWDEAEAAIKERSHEGEIFDAIHYLDRTGDDGFIHAPTKIALIYATGAIVSGGGEPSPFGDSSATGSDAVGRAFDEALKDATVKAIVLRIDSPGGSYVASDTIWREVKRARARGKPVIASMGSTAASGGYFAAMAADKVIAQPGTITGSIGVFSGKMAIGGLLDKIGVKMDSVQIGKHAGIWSQSREFTPEGWAVLEKNLDAVYADFTGKAAEARSLSTEAIDKAARGRIFTGKQAIAVGLVDALGGYAEAAEAARQAAGIKPETEAHLVPFPKPKKPIEMLLEAFDDGRLPIGGSESETRALLVRLGVLPEPLRDIIAASDPNQGPLRMPPFTLR